MHKVWGDKTVQVVCVEGMAGWSQVIKKEKKKKSGRFWPEAGLEERVMSHDVTYTEASPDSHHYLRQTFAVLLQPLSNGFLMCHLTFSSHCSCSS